MMGVHYSKKWQSVLALTLLGLSSAAWSQAVNVPISSLNAIQKRMAFSFQDVPARALLQVLGETAGVNIVADDSITGNITLNLKDATWQEALDVIARSKHLRVEQDKNTYFVRGENFELGNGLSGSANASDGIYRSPEVIELQYQKAEGWVK